MTIICNFAVTIICNFAVHSLRACAEPVTHALNHLGPVRLVLGDWKGSSGDGFDHVL